MDHPAPIDATTSEADDWRARIAAKLIYQVGKSPLTASERDWFVATALAVRDTMLDRWFASTRNTHETGAKRVYYLSLEFLIGRLLFDSMGNLGLIEPVRAALAAEGVDLDRIKEQEPDAALGNGGLGRLAACFMESMATLGIPAYGYGIRYEHGLFRQVMRDGVQEELPEDWLRFGNPWEFERAEVAYPVGFGANRSAESSRPTSAVGNSIPSDFTNARSTRFPCQERPSWPQIFWRNSSFCVPSSVLSSTNSNMRYARTSWIPSWGTRIGT